MAAARERFEQLGRDVEEVDPPGGDPSAIFRTCGGRARRSSSATCRRRKRPARSGLRQMAEEGGDLAEGLSFRQRCARRLWQHMRQFMERYDFLLTPSVATPAFDVGRLSPLDDDGNAWMAWTPFSFPFNLTQQPAASMPCGFSRRWLAGRVADRRAHVRRRRRPRGFLRLRSCQPALPSHSAGVLTVRKLNVEDTVDWPSRNYCATRVSSFPETSAPTPLISFGGRICEARRGTISLRCIRRATHPGEIHTTNRVRRIPQRRG